MKFFDPLIIQWTGSNSWILYKELRCESEDHLKFYVPAGFETDLASIPRTLWSILPPQGPWARASVLHDWLYEQQQFSAEMSEHDARRKCDRLFWEAMRDDEVELQDREMIYAAVRVGGERAYEE